MTEIYVMQRKEYVIYYVDNGSIKRAYCKEDVGILRFTLGRIREKHIIVKICEREVRETKVLISEVDISDRLICSDMITRIPLNK